VPLPFIVGAGVLLIAIGIVVVFVKEPGLSDRPSAEREPGIWASVGRAPLPDPQNSTSNDTLVACGGRIPRIDSSP
jgi:hypothetical protein